MNWIRKDLLQATPKMVFRSVVKQTAVVAILAMLIIMIFPRTNFYTQFNIMSMITSASVLLILAFGVSFPIISGALDLSIGGTLALSGIIAIRFMEFMPMSMAIVCAILAGALIGFVNGFFVVHQRTEPFIITLGMDLLLRGIAQQVTNARPIPATNPNFMMIFHGNIFGIPNPIIIIVLIFALTHYILRYTQFGRNCYAIGGDYGVAVYSGIPVIRTKWTAFVICGAMAAFAGVLLSSRLNAASSLYGEGMALLINCAVVLGGTSFAGGIGSIPQSGIGLMVFAVLENAMNMLRIDAYIQQIFRGLVIVSIIWLDCYKRKRKREMV